jgi:hypothetical protein
MKRIQSVTLLLVFFITSCAGQGRSTPLPPTSTAPKITPIVPSRTFTPRLTQTPSLSRTPLFSTVGPSSTPRLDPAFLSTFDPKTAVTRTHSNQQKCPKVNQALKPDFPLERDRSLVPYSEYWPKALEFLNAGGKPSLLRDYLAGTNPEFGAEVDLTGDGVPELLISSVAANVLMCVNGRYEDMLSVVTGDPFPSPRILAIQDMNLDGMPELILKGNVMSAGELIYYIYEWNGTAFQSLIWSNEKLSPWFHTSVGKAMIWYGTSISDEEELDGLSDTATIEDVDGNGTLELILHGNIPIPKYLYDGPWRKITETYQWNGYYFALSSLDIIPPVYRFQAVEDADRLSLMGKYQQALNLYLEAISSHTLAAWILDQYHSQFRAEISGTPTPTLIPFNQEEYNNLAAYALYRIMLLHVMQFETDTAETAYNDLIKNYPVGQTGHLYAELAAQFWENYSILHRIGEGCSAAIRFADDHKDDIYTYLGNVDGSANTYGYWSHYYTSWDLCPFE